MTTYAFKCLTRKCYRAIPYKLEDTKGSITCPHCGKVWNNQLVAHLTMRQTIYDPRTHETFITPVLLDVLLQTYANISLKEYLGRTERVPARVVTILEQGLLKTTKSFKADILKEMDIPEQWYDKHYKTSVEELTKRGIQVLPTWTHGGFGNSRMPLGVVYGKELKKILIELFWI